MCEITTNVHKYSLEAHAKPFILIRMLDPKFVETPRLYNKVEAP